jgi:hypothetical protein
MLLALDRNPRAEDQVLRKVFGQSRYEEVAGSTLIKLKPEENGEVKFR